METLNSSGGRRVPWNKGRLTGQKPPLKLPEIWAIRTRFQMSSNVRELALFNVAIDSKLRACDLTRLQEHGRPRGLASNIHAAENSTTGAVRNHRADPAERRGLDFCARI